MPGCCTPEHEGDRLSWTLSNAAAVRRGCFCVHRSGLGQILFVAKPLARPLVCDDVSGVRVRQSLINSCILDLLL